MEDQRVSEEHRWMMVVGERQGREKSTDDGGEVEGVMVVAVDPSREKRHLYGQASSGPVRS